MHRVTSPTATLLPFVPARLPQSCASGGHESPRPLSGTDREHALIDAWREAHWSLRVTLQEVARRCGDPHLDRLYDEARRADNELNGFYKARAEVLGRQLRDAIAATSRDDESPGLAVDDTSGGTAHATLTIPERALVARFRAMGEGDRAALLRLAVRLASTTCHDLPTR